MDPPRIYANSFGSQGSANGQLSSPNDLALDAEGNIWVADKANNRIEKFSPGGGYLSKFGSSGTGNGQLNAPTALVVDAEGNIWVADHGNNRIQKFNAKGEYLSKFGSTGTSNGQFSGPEGIAIDSEGNVWASDKTRVQEFSSAGTFKAILPQGSEKGQIKEPTGIAVGPEDRIWVADWSAQRISVFDKAGNFIRQFGSEGGGDGQFHRPSALTVTEGGIVWVSDSLGNRVEAFEEDGSYLSKFGKGGSGEGEMSNPAGIAVDEVGDIWVADKGNNRVQEWELDSSHEEEIEVQDGDPSVSVESNAGLISSVEGNAAGENTYTHVGDLLTAYSGPEGETKYEYDPAERLKKVTLPHSTWGEIAYFEDGRVKSVTVSVEGGEAKKTTFSYEDMPERRTTVTPPNDPKVIYDIDEYGSVFKWSNVKAPPELQLSGSLHVEREKDTISTGAYNLEAYANSYEGLVSLEIITNGDTLIAEKTCEECEELTKEWVTETWEHPPGHLQVEVVATDRNGESTTERFWVNIPYTPPPSPEADEPPHFSEVLKFHEEYGLEKIFPVKDEFELDDRIFEMIGAWHNPDTPLGEVARATDARWGTPLRPQEAAEMEYREWYIGILESEIDDWGYAHFPSTYAGYEVDHRAGGIFRIGFTEGQQQRVTEFIEQVDPPAADRIQPFLYTPSRSIQSLEVREAEVLGAAEGSSQLNSLISEIGTEDAQNAVIVGSSNVGQAEQQLAQQLGSLSGVSVVYQPNFGEVESGRNRWSGRMLAGDRIVTEWENHVKTPCTAAFGAYEDRKRQSDGQLTRTRFLLSAGHCAPLDQNVSRTSEGGPAYQLNKVFWSQIGHVTRESLENPGFVDALAIKLESEGLAPSQIYGHDGERPAIQPPEVAHRGQRLCVSGAESNRVRCGQVIGIKHVYYGEDLHKRLGVLKVDNLSTIPGDSGAPVWSAKGGAAIGILSGGIHPGPIRLVVPLLNTPTGHGKNGNGVVGGALHAPGMYDLHIGADGG